MIQVPEFINGRVACGTFRGYVVRVDPQSAETWLVSVESNEGGWFEVMNEAEVSKWFAANSSEWPSPPVYMGFDGVILSGLPMHIRATYVTGASHRIRIEIWNDNESDELWAETEVEVAKLLRGSSVHWLLPVPVAVAY